MTEMTWTIMRIGGELPANKIAELREIVVSEFIDLQYDEGFGIDNLNEVAAAGKSLFIQGSVNDGNPQATADFCRNNNLAFWLHYDAGYEWDAASKSGNSAWTKSKSAVPARKAMAR